MVARLSVHNRTILNVTRLGWNFLGLLKEIPNVSSNYLFLWKAKVLILGVWW